MNSNSISIEQLNHDLEAKREQLQVVHTREEDAGESKSASQVALNHYAKTRVWTSEMKRELTTQELALAERCTAEISAGARDLTAAATELRRILDQEALVALVNRRIVEVEEPAARDALLLANLGLMTARADIAQLTADVHSLEVLAAAQTVGALEGAVEIKGQKSAQLARAAHQAIQDREAAADALRREREIEQARREKTTGSVSWTNPS